MSAGFSIGPLRLAGRAVLAPMAGVTDSAFRGLCLEQGAALVYTEMVSAKALCYNDRKTAALLHVPEDGRPVSAQIFGHEPQSMAEAEQAPLRKVIVLRGVTGLDSGTFRECHDLRAVYLPDTLEYVGIYPFYDLKDVTIYFPSDAPSMTHGLIGESTGVTIVHRPGTTGWDQEILRYYAGDEYPEYSVVERNYIVNWLPFGR